MTDGALATHGLRAFVQFPHPGREHPMPASGLRPWTRGDSAHKRSFLRCPGSYRGHPTGLEHEGDVVFWGEWEGETRLEAELPSIAHRPRYVCRPVVDGSPPSDAHVPPQNTDPFVFGERMLYTACRQPRNEKLRSLGRGTVIAFGSSVGGSFVLDLVFVVAGWVDHRRDDYVRTTAPHTTDIHRRMTLDPWYGWGDPTTFRLYVGATPDDPVDGMFSFVPALPVTSRPQGFPRPAFVLPGLVNPNLRMQAKTCSHLASDELQGVWYEAVDAVMRAGLVLATRIDVSSAVGENRERFDDVTGSEVTHVDPRLGVGGRCRG